MKFQSFVFEKEKTLEFHKELNEKIWDKTKDGYVLDEKVREKLLEIADAWIEYAKIPKKTIKNVLFTGSLANYNYTQFSDVDLHILIDYDLINKDFDFLYDYFKDKKLLWSENHDIKIKGYPVELYAQPMTERPHTNQGVYSITSNKWIQEAKPVEINLDNDDVFDKKLSDFMEQIDDIVEGKGTIKNIEKFKEKIRKMRGAAIAKSGEFSQENLIFKSLRNSGYLDKLSKYHHGLVDKKLSLEKVITDVTMDKAKKLNERVNVLIDEAYEPGQETSETREEAIKRYNGYVNAFNTKFKNIKIEFSEPWLRVIGTTEDKEPIYEGALCIRNSASFSMEPDPIAKYEIKLPHLQYKYVLKKFVDYCRKEGFVWWWYNTENYIYIRKYKADNADSNINVIVKEIV